MEATDHPPEQLWLKPPPWANWQLFSCAAHTRKFWLSVRWWRWLTIHIFFLTPYSNAALIFKPAARSGQQKWLMLHYRILRRRSPLKMEKDNWFSFQCSLFSSWPSWKCAYHRWSFCMVSAWFYCTGCILIGYHDKQAWTALPHLK